MAAPNRRGRDFILRVSRLTVGGRYERRLVAVVTFEDFLVDLSAAKPSPHCRTVGAERNAMVGFGGILYLRDR